MPELLSKTPECVTEKLDIHPFSGFSNYMKNYCIHNRTVLNISQSEEIPNEYCSV